jgi:hypothetical protein
VGGGPSAAQNQAATAQANMSNQLASDFGQQFQFQQAQQNKANPFYTQTMNQGLPYYANAIDSQAGTNAQAFAPARAQLQQQLNQNANALPSGFAQGAQSDLAAQQARSFDQGLMGAQGANFQAQQQGASGLLGQAQIANPTAYSGQAVQGNSSIMNAPLASPGLGGLLGGALSSVFSF